METNNGRFYQMSMLKPLMAKPNDAEHKFSQSATPSLCTTCGSAERLIDGHTQCAHCQILDHYAKGGAQ